MTVPATTLAYRVAAHAEEVASWMAIYQTQRQGGDDRAASLAAAEAEMTQLNDEWLRLVLQHRLEAFERRVDEIDSKENPK